MFLRVGLGPASKGVRWPPPSHLGCDLPLSLRVYLSSSCSLTWGGNARARVLTIVLFVSNCLEMNSLPLVGGQLNKLEK